MFIYKYSRWDGSQEVFPVHEDDLMDQLSQHLMTQGDVSSALRTMIQRGVRGRFGERVSGVQDLLQRLRSMRQQATDRYDLNSVMQHIHQSLEEIERLERQGIDRRLQEVRDRFQELQSTQEAEGDTQEKLLSMMERVAARNKEFLDGLPEEAAGKISQLRNYEFMDPEAKARFDELLKSLQEKVLDRHMQDLSQRLEGLTPGDMARMKQMLRDLNRMLQEKMQGQQPGYQQFLEKYRDLMGPEPPPTLEEFIEHMQQQMAQMESLMRSMSPEMRQQLQDLMESVLQDQELRDEMAQLAANLEYLHPMGSMSREYPFMGDDPLTLDEAMELMRDLQGMDDLERQLKRTQQGSSLSEVDPQLLREVMGDEALRELDHLKSLLRVLEEAGYIRKMGQRFELTPKGMRRIGQKALQEIFAYIKRDRLGSHVTRLRGVGGEPTEETKKYEFGDPFVPNLQKSLMNAIMREAPGVPVHMDPGDFEVYHTEQLMQSSTVLMLDLSLSMAMRGNFLAAKKVALAMDNLIRTQFPRDAFYIVGFSTYAREVKSEKLPYLSWDEFDPYTNIQHGLALSQKLLSRVSGGTKQIIMISDGEPTAHIESGQLFLQYPPSPRTIRETLKEVKRCTGRGIVINTFMLDRNSYLVEFVDRMTRINKGRVFYTSPEHLGQYVLVDYFSSRRRKVLL